MKKIWNDTKEIIGPLVFILLICLAYKLFCVGLNWINLI